MTYKGLPMGPELQEYMLAASSPMDSVVAELVEETRRLLPDDAGMQVAPEQAAFLRLLTSVMGVRRAVEVGTFTGLSSLSIARGLADGGRLTCFDISEEFTSVARRYWKRAGVEELIELRIGAAADNLRALPADAQLDLVFIDADKGGYPTYWNELVPRVRAGGVLLVDNVLWKGRVLDPHSDSDRAIVSFNAMAADDDRVDLVVLPIADGLTMARKK